MNDNKSQRSTAGLLEVSRSPFRFNIQVAIYLSTTWTRTSVGNLGPLTAGGSSIENRPVCGFRLVLSQGNLSPIEDMGRVLITRWMSIKTSQISSGIAQQDHR